MHKEIAPARVQKDILAVEKVIEVLENVFISLWGSEKLLSLSTGVVAALEVKQDLFGASEKGKGACKAFVISRCSSLPTAEFFDPLRKTNLNSLRKSSM